MQGAHHDQSKGPDRRRRPDLGAEHARGLDLVGFEVAGIAGTVTQALALAEDTLPDLAILDARVGRCDGIQSATLFRERLGLPSVFVSAERDDASRERASKAGAVACPVHPQELIRAMEAAVVPGDVTGQVTSPTPNEFRAV